jgi:hypothetical protein
MVLAMVTVVLLNAIGDCITDEIALGFAQHVGLGSSRLVSLFVLGYFVL